MVSAGSRKHLHSALMTGQGRGEGKGQGKMTGGDKLNSFLQVGALYAGTVLVAERSVHNYQDVHLSKAADVSWSELRGCA